MERTPDRDIPLPFKNGSDEPPGLHRTNSVPTLFHAPSRCFINSLRPVVLRVKLCDLYTLGRCPSDPLGDLWELMAQPSLWSGKAPVEKTFAMKKSLLTKQPQIHLLSLARRRKSEGCELISIPVWHRPVEETARSKKVTRLEDRTRNGYEIQNKSPKFTYEFSRMSSVIQARVLVRASLTTKTRPHSGPKEGCPNA